MDNVMLLLLVFPWLLLLLNAVMQYRQTRRSMKMWREQVERWERLFRDK
jgi:hypothetical protein